MLQNVVQLEARPYHPALGRFLGVDPVEGGTANDYVYVTDPINSFDLNGMWGLPNPIAATTKIAEIVSDPVGPVGAVASSVDKHSETIATVWQQLLFLWRRLRQWERRS